MGPVALGTSIAVYKKDARADFPLIVVSVPTYSYDGIPIFQRLFDLIGHAPPSRIRFCGICRGLEKIHRMVLIACTRLSSHHAVLLKPLIMAIVRTCLSLFLNHPGEVPSATNTFVRPLPQIGHKILHYLSRAAERRFGVHHKVLLCGFLER